MQKRSTDHELRNTSFVCVMRNCITRLLLTSKNNRWRSL
jgi:hypothetical protein